MTTLLTGEAIATAVVSGFVLGCLLWVADLLHPRG